METEWSTGFLETSIAADLALVSLIIFAPHALTDCAFEAHFAAIDDSGTDGESVPEVDEVMGAGFVTEVAASLVVDEVAVAAVSALVLVLVSMMGVSGRLRPRSCSSKLEGRASGLTK